MPCVPTVPWQLPRLPIDASELDALEGMTFTGGCQCGGTEYTPPDGCPCSENDCTFTVLGYAGGSLSCGTAIAPISITVTDPSATIYLSSDGTACGDGCQCPAAPSSMTGSELLAFLGIGSFPTDCSYVGFTFSQPCATTPMMMMTAPAAADAQPAPSKGFGDTLTKAFSAVGITEARANKVAQAVGLKDCGCSKRRDMLNKLIPYGKAPQ